MHTSKAILVLAVFLAMPVLTPLSMGQENSRRVQALTNADVVRQEQLGESEGEIIAIIERHQTAFAFDKTSIAALTKAGVSANVKNAMFNSYLREGTPQTVSPVPPTPARTSPAAETAHSPSTGTPPPPIVTTTPSAAGTVPQSMGGITPQTAEAARTAATASLITIPMLNQARPQRPVSAVTRSPSSRSMALNWRAITTHEIYESGDYTFVVDGVNDIIYQYELTVSLNPPVTADNIKILADAIKGSVTPTPARNLQGCDALQTAYGNANDGGTAIQTALSGLLPTKQPDGKYPSIPLNQTLNQWDEIKLRIPAYVGALAAVKAELTNTTCSSIDAPDLVGKAAHLVLDYNGTIKPKLESIEAVANGNHTLNGDGFLDRTRGGSVIVRELFAGTDTSISPRTFPLEATFSVMTASAGFLLTTLPSRSYSSVNQPAATSSGATTTVLGVSGNSSVRPALSALLNFHDPFSWPLNKPNFGFAISAGPVIEVANGQADTSKFGFFGGVSVHLWKQLFITPGVHVGEFADFHRGSRRRVSQFLRISGRSRLRNAIRLGLRSRLRSVGVTPLVC